MIKNFQNARQFPCQSNSWSPDNTKQYIYTTQWENEKWIACYMYEFILPYRFQVTQQSIGLLYIQRRLGLPNNENNTESKLPAQSRRDLLGATGPTPAGGVVLLSLLAVPLLVLLIGSILLLLLLLLLLRPVTLLVSPGLLLTSCRLLPSSLSIVPLLKYINICVKVINNWCMQLLKLFL